MFVDCPKCGTEFIVNDSQDTPVMKCPDCHQWLSDDLDGKGFAKAYYGSSKQLNDSYDDYDSDNYGYDY